MNQDVWDELHKKYAADDWINKPNIFAGQALEHFPKKGRLLDIGAGQGQDSRFFADHGYKVTAIDISSEALSEAEAKSGKSKIKFVKADISERFNYPVASFDIVYAHLSIHYFDTDTTNKILKDIDRVLKPGGIFAFFANSTADPECGQGKRLEENFFFVDGKSKRFFSVDSARQFANKYFEETLCDNEGETYKDAAKGIHNLIRYIGKKKA